MPLILPIHLILKSAVNFFKSPCFSAFRRINPAFGFGADIDGVAGIRHVAVCIFHVVHVHGGRVFIGAAGPGAGAVVIVAVAGGQHGYRNK